MAFIRYRRQTADSSATSGSRFQNRKNAVADQLDKRSYKNRKIAAYCEWAGSALGVIYCSLRTASLFTGAGYVICTLLLIAIGVASMFCETYSTITHQHKKLYRFAVYFSGLYVAFLDYNICSLVVFDLVYVILHFLTGIHDVLYVSSSAAFISGLLLAVYGFVHAHRPVIVPYSLHTHSADPSVTQKTTPCRIVQLSDLHVGPVIGSRYLSKVVEMTNAQHPDMVVVTGDIFNHGHADECADPDEAARVLSQIKAPMGVFAITGNHDARGDDPEFRRFLNLAHFQLIDDETVDTGAALLVGRCGIHGSRLTRKSLSSLLPQLPADKPVIVLDHDPHHIPEDSTKEVDLVLCGHTHAGQFFPCTFILHRYYGDKSFHGYGTWGHTQSIVSAGCGFFQVPVRVLSNSEIVVIDLNKDK